MFIVSSHCILPHSPCIVRARDQLRTFSTHSAHSTVSPQTFTIYNATLMVLLSLSLQSLSCPRLITTLSVDVSHCPPTVFHHSIIHSLYKLYRIFLYKIFSLIFAYVEVVIYISTHANFIRDWWSRS
jgi:hypothetical protein